MCLIRISAWNNGNPCLERAYTPNEVLKYADLIRIDMTRSSVIRTVEGQVDQVFNASEVYL